MNNSGPHKNTINSKRGSPRLFDQSDVIVDTGNEPGNHFLVRLQKMEKLNDKLGKVIEQGTKKLSEVVAENTKFISIIAHDLRGPLSSILGALEILKLKLAHYKIDDIENCISHASDSATRTLNLLESLLEWCVSQIDGKNFNPVKINVYKLIRDDIEDIRASARQKHIALNHSIAPDLNVSADLHMVKTIFRNLVGNAIKYTSTGGKISISVSEISSFVEITIKDSGIGISPEIQRKLFKSEEFNSTVGTNNEKGIGLGLLLCKDFIEMHGGYIRIQSELGKGSEIKFSLPHYL